MGRFTKCPSHTENGKEKKKWSVGDAVIDANEVLNVLFGYSLVTPFLGKEERRNKTMKKVEFLFVILLKSVIH